MLTDSVKDDIVRLAVLREVLVQVVDDLVGPERSHDLEALRVAHGRDVCTEVLRELNRCSADGARSAVDQDAPTLAKICPSQARECAARSVTNCRSLFEGHPGRLVPQRGGLRHADKLSVCAEALDAEDLVTDLELRDGGTDCFDLAGQLHAEDPLLRSTKADEGTDEERLRAAPAAVGLSDRRGVDLDEYLVLIGNGALDVFESLDIRRPVPVVDDCSH